ncbi:MAG TPA: hypothetical protein VGH36_12915 [Acetobacteraceae bacterium]|jgi:hypothetical protein
MAGRDGQRARVYAWEDRVVGPRDPTTLPFAAAQGLVDAIWAEMGLRFPPAVERMPAQATTRLADASRLVIRLPAQTPSWCVLHELAHAMTTTHDGVSDGHGATFMGMYVRLLVRYLRLDEAGLLASLGDGGIAVDSKARPVFLDA